MTGRLALCLARRVLRLACLGLTAASETLPRRCRPLTYRPQRTPRASQSPADHQHHRPAFRPTKNPHRHPVEDQDHHCITPRSVCRYTHGLALVAQPALAAMSRLSRENRAGTLARVAAWNKRQVRLLERKAERGAGRIARITEREAERLARGGLRLRRLKPGNWAFGRCAGLGAGDPDLMTAGRGRRCGAGNAGRFMGAGLPGRGDVVAAGHRRAGSPRACPTCAPATS